MNFRFLIPHSGFLIKGTDLKLVAGTPHSDLKDPTDLFSLSINSRRTLLVQRLLIFCFVFPFLPSASYFLYQELEIRNQKLVCVENIGAPTRRGDLLNANGLF